MTKRKLMLVALSLCMVAILAMGGTLAYLTDRDEATNVFTVGNVDIELTEPNWKQEDAVNSYPGEALPKDPIVQNIGNNPCYIRVGTENWEVLNTFSMSAECVDYGTDNTDDNIINPVEDKLGDDWVKGDDNYFYYTKVVEPTKFTTAVFTHIMIPADTTNASDNDVFEIRVWAEAVQSQGSTVTGDPATWQELQAWFNDCGFDHVIPTPELKDIHANEGEGEEPEGGEQA